MLVIVYVMFNSVIYLIDKILFKIYSVQFQQLVDVAQIVDMASW